MNDLPLLLKETEVDIYADDTTIWSSGATCTEIQQTLNEGLSKANSWFKLSEMQPTIKKTKHLVIGSTKKFYHSEKNYIRTRLQNSPYFCVFKYARAVKQKVSNKAENRERDWGE